MTNSELMYSWFEEVWNQRKASAIHEMMSDTTIIHGLTGPGGPPVRGASEFGAFHKAFLDRFPIFTWTLQTL